MIGKSLRERYTLIALPGDRAIAIATRALATHARPIVEVRARGAEMIACLVVGADKPTLKLCRELGFEMKPGGTAVFGLLGADASRLFEQLPSHQRTWLLTRCGERETKVLLVAGGLALLSLETHDGEVTLSAVP